LGILKEAILGFGMSFAHGATLVLARKFSSRGFWNDCIKTNATIFLYIGELARYLLNTYPTDESAEYIRRYSRVRMAMGNGLRPDIWKAFRDRFAIQHIGEFYASTEGEYHK
jgi:acyl-CoA synthetase (AMP-forming)/AMP-acid ligase II